MWPPIEIPDSDTERIEVQHDQGEDLPAALDRAPALEHEQRAEDAEDRARRADRRHVRAEIERPGRARQPGGGVEQREPQAADARCSSTRPNQ